MYLVVRTSSTIRVRPQPSSDFLHTGASPIKKKAKKSLAGGVNAAAEAARTLADLGTEKPNAKKKPTPDAKKKPKDSDPDPDYDSSDPESPKPKPKKATVKKAAKPVASIKKPAAKKQAAGAKKPATAAAKKPAAKKPAAKVAKKPAAAAPKKPVAKKRVVAKRGKSADPDDVELEGDADVVAPDVKKPKVGEKVSIIVSVSIREFHFILFAACMQVVDPRFIKMQAGLSPLAQKQKEAEGALSPGCGAGPLSDASTPVTGTCMFAPAPALHLNDIITIFTGVYLNAMSGLAKDLTGSVTDVCTKLDLQKDVLIEDMRKALSEKQVST